MCAGHGRREIGFAPARPPLPGRPAPAAAPGRISTACPAADAGVRAAFVWAPARSLRELDVPSGAASGKDVVERFADVMSSPVLNVLVGIAGIAIPAIAWGRRC